MSGPHLFWEKQTVSCVARCRAWMFLTPKKPKNKENCKDDYLSMLLEYGNRQENTKQLSGPGKQLRLTLLQSSECNGNGVFKRLWRPSKPLTWFVIKEIPWHSLTTRREERRASRRRDCEMMQHKRRPNTKKPNHDESREGGGDGRLKQRAFPITPFSSIWWQENLFPTVKALAEKEEEERKEEKKRKESKQINNRDNKKDPGEQLRMCEKVMWRFLFCREETREIPLPRFFSPRSQIVTIPTQDRESLLGNKQENPTDIFREKERERDQGNYCRSFLTPNKIPGKKKQQNNKNKHINLRILFFSSF